MKGIYGDGVIGIRVAPIVLHSSVVDRQQLYDSHIIGGSPIHQQPKIAKVAHSTGFLTAQGKYRQYHSGCLPQFLPLAHHASIEHPNLTIGHAVEINEAVVTLFPILQTVRLVIHNDIFIFKRLVHHFDIDGHSPNRLTCILHGYISR